MESQFKNSFIPKKPLESSVDLRSAASMRRHVGQTIFSLVGLVIFVATLAVYGGTFLWKGSLNNAITRQIGELQAARAEFDDRFIQEASRMSTRMNEAGSLLHNHLSPSSLYAFLEEYTLHTMSFSQFSFVDNADGTITVEGGGDAIGYESIVLQSDAFGRTGLLRNVIFTDFQTNEETDYITFTFEATLDPQLVLYRNSLTTNTNQLEQ